MDFPILSKNELAVMRTLWSAEGALSRPEILGRMPDQKWNPNSIHHILNNLMKKGFVSVEGMVRCGQSYGRSYIPLCTQAQYAASLAMSSMPETMAPADRAQAILVAMVSSDDISPETLEVLREMIGEGDKT